MKRKSIFLAADAKPTDPFRVGNEYPRKPYQRRLRTAIRNEPPISFPTLLSFKRHTPNNFHTPIPLPNRGCLLGRSPPGPTPFRQHQLRRHLQRLARLCIQQDRQHLHDQPNRAPVRFPRSPWLQRASWLLREPESTDAFA